MDHENAGRAPIEEVPVQRVERFAPCRVRPLEKKALPALIEILRGGIDAPDGGAPIGLSVALEQKPAGTAESGRERGIGGGIPGDDGFAVPVKSMVLVVRTPGGSRDCQQSQG
jgi:hypothetical protein